MKDELEKEKIQFEEKLTEDFKEEFQQIVNLTSMNMTPVIEYKNEYFLPGRDYMNPKQLIEILKVFEKLNYDDSKITVERLKTLNYNIASAFSRLNQTIVNIENKLNIKQNEHKSTD
jgi:hypothetical protein|tara:strand:+ start:162 stop:512 length:351 start_codon:yes stop_codon:yes gene_type:complete